MKRKFTSLIALLFVVGSLFSACSQGDEGKKNEMSGNNQSAVGQQAIGDSIIEVPNELVGMWYDHELTWVWLINTDGTINHAFLASVTPITSISDNSWLYATYEVNGDDITFTYSDAVMAYAVDPDESNVETMKFSIEDDRLYMGEGGYNYLSRIPLSESRVSTIVGTWKLHEGAHPGELLCLTDEYGTISGEEISFYNDGTFKTDLGDYGTYELMFDGGSVMLWDENESEYGPYSIHIVENSLFSILTDEGLCSFYRAE